MNKELEARFDDAMMDVYLRALNECDYKATRFLQMLHEHRGLETARILHASKVSCEQCTLQPCADALASNQTRNVPASACAREGSTSGTGKS